MNSSVAPKSVLLIAVRETAGSALYGMLDVLMAAGNIWQTLVGTDAPQQLFETRIISPSRALFTCGNNIPVRPDCTPDDDPDADIIILPELWLGPEEDMHGRYPELVQWLIRQWSAGACVYSACSGTILLAESGLLDGRQATSHWGYQELFRKEYPQVRFSPEPNLVFADPGGRIVTAGGTTSWHDLALHIISRHGSPGEALRIAKVYLLKWHEEGQLPFATRVRRTRHADSVVRAAEDWLAAHYQEQDALRQMVVLAKIPERTFKRRFKNATGQTLLEMIQNYRVEAAKKLLEADTTPVDEISIQVGYEDASFFRRLFKRLTGLTPSDYRRMFQPVMAMAGKPSPRRAG